MSDEHMDIHEQVDAIIKAAGRPKWENAEWAKQREVIIPELGALNADTRYTDRIGGLAALARMFRDGHMGEAAYQQMHGAAFLGLVEFVEKQAPGFAHMAGRDGVEVWCECIILARICFASGQEAAGCRVLEEMADLFCLRHPKNSDATLLSDGSLVLPLGLTPRQRFEAEALQRAFREQGHAGAKLHSHHKTKREPGPPMLECERVYELRKRWKYDWPDIYARLRPNGPPMHPSDTVEWGEKRYKKAAKKLDGGNPEETPD